MGDARRSVSELPQLVAEYSHAEVCQESAFVVRVVLVVAPPPDARLVAALGSAIEPLVSAPQRIEPSRIGRVRVIDRAILKDKGTHSWSIACVGGRVGSAHGGELANGLRRTLRIH